MGVTNKKTRTKTRRFQRDVDQVAADLKSARHLQLYKATKANEDLPGLGQFYCVECAKWFESEHNMTAHVKGKTHKRRLKALKDGAHTQADAEAAVGLRVDNGPARPNQLMEVEMEADTAT